MFGKGIFCTFIALSVCIVGSAYGLDYDNDQGDKIFDNYRESFWLFEFDQFRPIKQL